MGDVQVEREDAILTFTLSNPARRNAISVAMWQALRSRFLEASSDSSVRCIVIQGAAGHFAGGADISEFPSVRVGLDQLRTYHEDIIAPTLQAIRDCIHPTVALIEGVCIGGGLEIASQCDLRICATTARLGVPINQLGFPMAPDELESLLALAGAAVTLELLLEGRILSAAEAAQKGLVTRVVPDEGVRAEARACAARIAAGAPLAARLNKSTIRRLLASDTPLTRAERDRAFGYANSHDHDEGVRAFLEGRDPHFLGH